MSVSLNWSSEKFSKALDEKKKVQIVFLDLSKTFDRVWHRGILTKRTAKGFSKNMTDWLYSYLTDRKGVYLLGKRSNAGVPQGLISRSTLFIIFILYIK